jgi:aminopeptidase N
LLHWLETQLGRYPFSTTGGVTTSLDPGFALENQTRPTYPTLLGNGASVVVHELAHQWLGDSVAVEGWRDIWLNEGAATFMEARYAETHGGESANRWLRSWYDSLGAGDDFWRHDVADPCADHTGCANSIFAWWVYQRGGMALQALRNVIGDAGFWELLNGSTEEFEALAEEVSGQDLDTFFQAWLHAKQKPADTVANGLGQG